MKEHDKLIFSRKFAYTNGKAAGPLPRNQSKASSV